ncbi:DUF4197 domain-containing protein [Arenimonas alkanexedens]
MKFAAIALALLVFTTGAAHTVQAEDWKDRLKRSFERSDSGVTEQEAAGGIREALAQGVQRAVRQLGQQDGFYGNEGLRIRAPGQLRKITDTARQLGAGRKVDEFELAMNRAAEKAVPMAADIFADAVREMSVSDALDIVRGDEDAGTRFFRRVTEDRLRAQFRPIVSDATQQAGVTQSYKAVVGRNSALISALGGSESVDLDDYVTNEALDGLFEVVAQQEREIRRDPAQRSSELLRKVFGSR